MVHVVVGSGIFLLIAIPAVVINLLVKWLDGLDLGTFLIWGLEAAEYSLFAVDIILFLVFLARTAWRTIPKL